MRSGEGFYAAGFVLGSQHFSNYLFLHTQVLNCSLDRQGILVIPNIRTQVQGQQTNNKLPCFNVS